MATKRVRPRAGIILAGIPAAGAEIDAALADEWIRNGLVVAIEPPPPPKPVKRAPARED